MGEVGCIVVQAEILVGYLGGSVLKIDLYVVVKKLWVHSGSRLQVMHVVSLG